ncbi:EAL domain-containing protein [Nevskia sp.]|uniref:EAL domain-containing protein n=1 Tax=Nevskia sp. TaxID=1929292 RepID=UPI003F6FC872
MSSTRSRPRADDAGLRWHQSLQFRLAGLFAGLLALLAAVAFYAAEQLIVGSVDDASLRHEMAINQRLQAETQQLLRAVEQFAQTLARIGPRSDAATLTQLGDSLLAGLPVAGYGLWPEPVSTAPGSRHDDRHWSLLPDGRARLLGDEGRSAALAWWREPWYTPVRLAPATMRGCHWSAPYRDPLLGRAVVSCAVAITGGRGFEGVATVSLDVAQLGRQMFGAGGDDRSYALVADRRGALLAVSAPARRALGLQDDTAAPTLAALAERLPAFAEVAGQLRQRDDAFRAAALRSARYDARLVSSLKDNTRELDRDAAEDLLAGVWNAADGRIEPAAVPLRLAVDPVFGETGHAVVAAVPGSRWLLISASPAREGSERARRVNEQVLAVSLGGSALVLLLSFALLQRLVIRPLRAMGSALAGTTVDGRTATLDESGAGELRQIAHWHNERSERLAEMRDRANIATTQLNAENSERLRTQDALMRLGEKLRLLTESVDEGLLVLDERGAIEDLNSRAEQWLAVNAPSLRGRLFSQVFAARVGTADGPPLPDLMQLLQAGSHRVDHPVVVLLPAGSTEARTLGVRAVALRSRFDRLNGAVIVLREGAADGAAEPSGNGTPAAPAGTEFVDPVTGLGGRKACERRVRELHREAREHATQGHWALAKLDFPELRQVRESRSHSDADAVAARCGERLAALLGGTEHVFRLAPDRFGVLLPADTAEQALRQAETLRQQIAGQRLLVGDHWIDPQPAIGLCLIGAGIDTPAEVMRRAGLACDRAHGSLGVLLHSAELETVAGVDEELLWVRRIERGLEHRLFHLTTQSVQPARSHANDGEVFDVLLSLEDEEGFWAPLPAFLPVAERHLLGAPLDQWVIRSLFDKLAAQPDLGTRLAFCTVPLSADSLGDAALIDFIAEQINRQPRVAVGKLCFLLRDELLTGFPQQAARCLESLRKLGCRTAIDHRDGRQIDYIDLLRKLPISVLRLDAGAFARIVDDQVEQTLAETAIRLAKLNGARTLVTEIGSEAQAAVWRRLGADYLQGPAIARPSPVPFKA